MVLSPHAATRLAVPRLPTLTLGLFLISEPLWPIMVGIPSCLTDFTLPLGARVLHVHGLACVRFEVAGVLGVFTTGRGGARRCG